MIKRKNPLAVLNPAQPSEGPLENLRNALTILGALESEPQLFGLKAGEDAHQMIKDANTRLRVAEKQLKG